MRWLALCLSLLAATQVALARDMVPAEKRIQPFKGSVPLCEDPSVLNDITTRFAQKERQFWNSTLEIVQYEQVRPLAWRPWGLDTVPRLFCTANVMVSDGRRRRVDYSVREDLGFAGFVSGVEFCVTGLDRNFAYAPGCRAARP